MKIAEVLRSPRPGARLEPLPADQANCPFKIGDRVQPDPTHWKSGNQHLLKRAGLYTDSSVVKTVAKSVLKKSKLKTKLTSLKKKSEFQANAETVNFLSFSTI